MEQKKMKKLIIHMVSGDEYHIEESEDSNRLHHQGIKGLNECITSGDYVYANITNRSGYDITYVSRFAINKLEEVTLRIDKISSTDLLEED